jgi:hypothetical protein
MNPDRQPIFPDLWRSMQALTRRHKNIGKRQESPLLQGLTAQQGPGDSAARYIRGNGLPIKVDCVKMST